MVVFFPNTAINWLKSLFITTVLGGMDVGMCVFACVNVSTVCLLTQLL